MQRSRAFDKKTRNYVAVFTYTSAYEPFFDLTQGSCRAECMVTSVDACTRIQSSRKSRSLMKKMAKFNNMWTATFIAFSATGPTSDLKAKVQGGRMHAASYP